MIFTLLGKIAACVCIAHGVLLLLAFFFPLPPETGFEPPTGRQVDRAVYAILIGIFLGVLCEISSNLRAARKPAHTKEGQS